MPAGTGGGADLVLQVSLFDLNMHKPTSFISIAFLTLLSILVTSAWVLILSQGYPFVLAGEEARQSLTVTAEQNAEIRQAKRSSDVIAFGIAGALLTAAVSVSVWPSLASAVPPASPKLPWSSGAFFAFFNVLAGVLAGIAGGWIGAALESSTEIDIQDPMLYQMVKACAMLAPLALAVAIPYGIASRSLSSLGKATVGTLLGMVIGGVIFGILCGSVSQNEGRELVIPFHNVNRFLFLFVGVMGIGIGLLTIHYARPEPASPPDPASPKAKEPA